MNPKFSFENPFNRPKEKVEKDPFGSATSTETPEQQKTRQRFWRNIKLIVAGELLLTIGGYFGYHNLTRSSETAENKKQPISASDVMKKIESQETELTAEERRKLKEQIERISANLSLEVIAELIEVHALLKENQKYIPSKPVVERFEQIGLDNKLIAEMVSDPESYPEGLVNGNVSKIEFVGKISSTKPTQDKKSFAIADFNTEQSSITFYLHPNKTAAQVKNNLTGLEYDLEEILDHELGHAGAWDGRVNLSLKDRIEFLDEAITRYDNKIFTEDRFNLIENYVGNIQHPNKAFEKTRKIQEWMAIATNAYFNYHGYLSARASATEREFFDRRTKGKDNNFDSISAMHKRSEYMRKIIAKGKITNKNNIK